MNEVCRPVAVDGLFVATPAMGYCALCGPQFIGLPFLRPLPLHPEAAATVRIWGVRQNDPCHGTPSPTAIGNLAFARFGTTRLNWFSVCTIILHTFESLNAYYLRWQLACWKKTAQMMMKMLKMI